MKKNKKPGRSARSYQREIQKLKEIIFSAEWVQPAYNGSPSCPFCGNQQHWDHAEGCPILALTTVETGVTGEKFRVYRRGRNVSMRPIVDDEGVSFAKKHID